MEIETLKAMSQEDLVRLVQEQKELIEKLEKEKKENADSSRVWSEKYYKLRDTIRNVCELSL